MSGRGLYSLVDWNIIPSSGASRRMGVEAYTASWIEMLPVIAILAVMMSRLIQPRGLK